jgi:hypothetical protein
MESVDASERVAHLIRWLTADADEIEMVFAAKPGQNKALLSPANI